MRKSSTTTIALMLQISLLVLCKKSWRTFAMRACMRCKRALDFFQFLLPLHLRLMLF